MRDDADFAAYLAARWPFLVRAMVLIGCPRDEAEHVVRSGLARCYASWDRVRRADDVDVHVWATVLEGWHRSRRRRRQAVEMDRPAPEPVAIDDPTDPVALCRALEAQLDRLTPEHREALVLRFVADLTEPQVADVLDIDNVTARSRTADGLARLDLDALREMTG